MVDWNRQWADLVAWYPGGMVTPALRSAVDALSADERVELVAYIEDSLPSAVALTPDQVSLLRARRAELRSDPTIGLTWDELDARLGSAWA